MDAAPIYTVVVISYYFMLCVSMILLSFGTYIVMLGADFSFEDCPVFTSSRPFAVDSVSHAYKKTGQIQCGFRFKRTCSSCMLIFCSEFPYPFLVVR